MGRKHSVKGQSEVPQGVEPKEAKVRLLLLRGILLKHWGQILSWCESMGSCQLILARPVVEGRME